MARSWKAVEKRIANWLSENTPWKAVRKSRFFQGEAVEDIVWNVCSIEVKSRQDVPPKYILDWLDQAKKNAGERVPLVVIHRDGMRIGNQIVVVRLEDFISLMKGAYVQINQEHAGS